LDAESGKIALWIYGYPIRIIFDKCEMEDWDADATCGSAKACEGDTEAI
jgi:hypothetical protein